MNKREQILLNQATLEKRYVNYFIQSNHVFSQKI